MRFVFGVLVCLGYDEWIMLMMFDFIFGFVVFDVFMFDCLCEFDFGGSVWLLLCVVVVYEILLECMLLDLVVVCGGEMLDLNVVWYISYMLKLFLVSLGVFYLVVFCVEIEIKVWNGEFEGMDVLLDNMLIEIN